MVGGNEKGANESQRIRRKTCDFPKGQTAHKRRALPRKVQRTHFFVPMLAQSLHREPWQAGLSGRDDNLREDQIQEWDA